MASILKVDKLDPQSGTALEIGTSGDTITVPSGATFNVAGTLQEGGSALVTGKILQMQHMTNNSLQTFSSSTYADSAITDTITCSSTSNSVMVMLSLSITKSSETTTGAVRINEIVDESVTDTRNITDIWGWETIQFGGQISYNWISTPATTSEVTYTVQVASEQDVNYIQTNNYKASDNRAVSTLILMEIDGT